MDASLISVTFMEGVSSVIGKVCLVYSSVSQEHKGKLQKKERHIGKQLLKRGWMK